MFLDFKAIKRLASLEQVAAWLFGNDIKNARVMCPVNEGDKRELVLTYDKGLWHCFGCKKGGDQIELVAHVCQIPQKEAAQHIQTKFHGYTPVKKGLPEDGLDYLEAEHIDVQALGLSPETAKELGIGYAPRGTMIKRVLFPLRDKQGKLLGYIGFNATMTPILKLPSNLCG
jgi:DNA primase